MEWIKTLRERQQSSKQNNITLQAHDSICLDDFDGKIYIAYNGTPMIRIEEKWTQKEILAKLEETRQGFINYRMKKLSLPKAAAF